MVQRLSTDDSNPLGFPNSSVKARSTRRRTSAPKTLAETLGPSGGSDQEGGIVEILHSSHREKWGFHMIYPLKMEFKMVSPLKIVILPHLSTKNGDLAIDNGRGLNTICLPPNEQFDFGNHPL